MCEGCSKLFWEIMTWFLIVSSLGCTIIMWSAMRLSSKASRKEEDEGHRRPMSFYANNRPGPNP